MPGYNSLANFPPLTGTVVANTAALVDITPLPKYAVPGNQTVGSTFKVTAFGRYTCGGTATNLLLGVYLGSTATLLAGTLSTQALTVSQTNAPWQLEYVFTYRSLGATGSVYGHGWVDLGTSVSAASHLPVPATANAAITVDTTGAQNIIIGATLSQITGSPTVICDHVLVEAMSTLN